MRLPVRTAQFEAILRARMFAAIETMEGDEFHDQTSDDARAVRFRGRYSVITEFCKRSGCAGTLSRSWAWL